MALELADGLALRVQSVELPDEALGIAAGNLPPVGVGEPLVFSGLMARILTELVQLGGPAPWEVVAGAVWPDERDAFSLRKRWDVTLGRLRSRLKEIGRAHV